MSITIGIDLGTSTTEAAVYRNGKPEMIRNADGQAIIPSFIGIDESGNWVVGERAKAQRLLLPECTAMEVKRKTGTGERIALGKTSYEPVELQAKLLSYVRTYASEYIGENIDHAVISVPAYFNEIQRRETIRAGELAGFSVERILNEPTAAALSYGLEHMDEESHILVYDLGGGTFDVTLLEMFDGVLEVKASSGDNQLGGKDFDEAIMTLLLTRFSDRYGKKLQKEAAAMARIREEAEKCKLALSTQDSYRVLLPAVSLVNGNPVALDEIVTCETFEKITSELLRRTHEPINVVLEDSGLSEADIDSVILVGGSTRMPMVRRDILDFIGKEPLPLVDPDCAVAEGAAIQAGLISGEIDPAQGLIMTDVNPYTLGIRAADWTGDTDNMSIVIPRNVTIPVTRTERYSTFSDWQTKAFISVYQGESRVATHNHHLGEFTIGGIPPAPAGRESLDVEFSYDLNGMLKVTATVCSTGQDASIAIDMLKGDEEKPDLSGWKNAPGAKAYRAIIRKAERLLARSDSALSPELRERLLAASDRLKEALLSGDADGAENAEETLASLLEETGL